MKKKKIKDTRTLWVVESYDNDQDQGFTDLVPAETAEDARQIIGEIRYYTTVTNAQSVFDQLRFAKKMAKTSIKRALKDLEPIMEEAGKMLCCECGEACDQNVSGKCESCEDEELADA